MNCQFYKKALKQFNSLPRNIQKQINDKMKFYLSQEDPLKFAKRLSRFELGEYRFRIGDYRVTFDVENETAYILLIDHRSTVYKRH